MISSNQEEKELKDKLAQLEKKYKSNLFEEPEIPLSEPLETPELLEIPKPSDIPESIETPELPELPRLPRHPGLPVTS